MISRIWTILVREKRLPWRVSRWLESVRLNATGIMRVLPDFIIIGAPKCGTTSLYNYLIQHPDVCPAIEKETRYFDQRFHHSLWWYRGNFPTVFRAAWQRLSGRRFVAGESTPTYLFDRATPARVRAVLPDVKLIVLVREPVDRAFSNYNMEVRNGAESLSFEDALAAEEERLADPRIETLSDGTAFPYNELHYAYVARGRYTEQIDRWLEHFPAENLLVLKSEDMYEDPRGVVNRTFDFLGLPGFELEQYETFYPGQYNSKLDAATRARLDETFAPWNDALAKRFGVRWCQPEQRPITPGENP
ncbi:MAG: sulfotransferase domain-containing protein [Gammaproteobacteria bacterium]